MNTTTKIVATIVLVLIAATGAFAIYHYSSPLVPVINPVMTASSTDVTVSTTTVTGSPTQTEPSTTPIPAPKPHAYGRVTLKIGQKAIFPDFSITPTKILEDSRCPYNVRCIQAGTTRVTLSIVSSAGTYTLDTKLGTTTNGFGASVMLNSALPERDSRMTLTDAEYYFGFDVQKTAPVAQAKCVIGGCSSEICSDQGMVSSCIYRAQYACYKTATCERQPSGSCGWTPTPALTSCLAQNMSTGTAIY